LQSLSPLSLEDFEKKTKVIVSKVEIDKTGYGDFVELGEFTDWNISSSIGNFVSQFCVVNFSITLLNINNKYSLNDESRECYGWIRNGRRVKIYVGIEKSDTSYNWQWIIGRIEPPVFREEAGKKVCTISGCNYMNALASTQLIQEYWGRQLITNTVSEKDEYPMPSSCKGVYRAFMDSTSPYDGTNMKEISKGSEWTYDWDTNIFMILYSVKPHFTGKNNLIIYYFRKQLVENVVADILIEAGVLMHYDRDSWLGNSKYVTPTNTYIDRVWFNKGTSCMEAVRLLGEVVLYRLDFDYAGNPIFRPKAQYSTPVKQLSDLNLEIKNISDTSDEVKNYISIKGEERSKLVKIPTVTTQSYTERIRPSVWSGLIEYIIGDYVRPTTGNDYIYECVNGGTSGETEPSWPTTPGSNKTDGGVIWKCRDEEIIRTTIKIMGTIDSVGHGQVIKRGFQWGKEQKAIETWHETKHYFEVGTYEHTLEDLDLDTDYFFRAWVYSRLQGTFFGQWQNYKTPEEPEEEPE